MFVQLAEEMLAQDRFAWVRDAGMTPLQVVMAYAVYDMTRDSENQLEDGHNPEMARAYRASRLGGTEFVSGNVRVQWESMGEYFREYQTAVMLREFAAHA